MLENQHFGRDFQEKNASGASNVRKLNFHKEEANSFEIGSLNFYKIIMPQKGII